MRVRPKRSRAKLAVLLSTAVPLVCWDQEWRGPASDCAFFNVDTRLRQKIADRINAFCCVWKLGSF